MKNKITLKIIYSIIIFIFNINILNAQAPHNWTNFTPTRGCVFPCYDSDPYYHEANDALILSDGSVISAGVRYRYSNYADWDNLIEKFNSAGVFLNSFRWGDIYICSNTSKVIQIGANQSDDIYSIVNINGDPWCYLDTSAALIKLDSSLSLQWSAFFSSPAELRELAIDPVGNPYVAYITVDSVSVSGKKIVVAKYDVNSGAQLWKKDIKDYNNSHISTLNDMEIDQLGNAYLCGAVNNPVWLKNFLIVKVNSNGTLGWRKYYDGFDGNGNPGNDEAYSLTIDNDQNILVTGASHRDIRDFDFVTIKYNPQGDKLWHKRKDFYNQANGGRFVKVDCNNNVYVAGYNSNNNSALIKYDINGNLIWQRRYTNFRIHAMITSPVGNCYLAGDKTFYGTVIVAADKAHIKKILANGNAEWNYSDPKSLNIIDPYIPEIAYASSYNAVVIKENLQKVAASGYTNFQRESASLDYFYDITWLTDHFSPTLKNGTISNEGYNADVLLMPNPANNAIQIQFKDEIEQAQLTILDLEGREVMNKIITSKDETINVSELKPGVYVARLIYDENVINKKFVKE